MALKGYFGSPGSGKTYEVVENVILPALSQGRRVVTNIAGLDMEAIREHLAAKGVPDEKIQDIKKIVLDESIAGKFARIVGDGENAYLDEENSIIRGGDMVVLDEVWRCWEEGTKLHIDDKRFLRLHRHLSHPETRITCDIALIAQNYNDVHRSVRSLIEERYEMRKHLALGMRNRYLVSIYTKGARRPHKQLQRSYRAEIYSLYKSHSMGSGDAKEVEVDARGNVFNSFFFKIGIPLAVMALGFGLWKAKAYFDRPKKDQAKVEQKKDSASAEKLPAEKNSETTKLQVPQSSSNFQTEENLSAMRVVGYVSDGNRSVLFLDVGTSGLIQLIAPPDAVIIGQYVTVNHEGKLLGTYSGQRANASESTSSLPFQK